MNILDAIANDPNVSPAFAAAIRPTKAPALTAYERAELKRDKEDQDHRERVLGDAHES